MGNASGIVGNGLSVQFPIGFSYKQYEDFHLF